MGGDRGREILSRNVGGYAAEVAVARMLGLTEWMPEYLPRFRKTEDLPGGIEVRHAEDHSYNLLVYGRDQDEAPLVLVTGDPDGELRAAGWITAGRGREVGEPRDDMVRDARVPDPCWLVRQSDLFRMDEMPGYSRPVTDTGTMTEQPLCWNCREVLPPPHSGSLVLSRDIMFARCVGCHRSSVFVDGELIQPPRPNQPESPRHRRAR